MNRTGARLCAAPFRRPGGSNRVDLSGRALDAPTGLRPGLDSDPQFRGDCYDLGWLT